MTIPQEPVYVVGPRGPKGEPGDGAGLSAEAVSALIATALAALPPSGLTEAQVVTLVNSALSALPTDGVTTMDQVTTAIATALMGYYTKAEVDAAFAAALEAAKHYIIAPKVHVEPGTVLDLEAPYVTLTAIRTDEIDPVSSSGLVDGPANPPHIEGVTWQNEVTDPGDGWGLGPKGSGGLSAEGGYAAVFGTKIIFGGGDGNLEVRGRAGRDQGPDVVDPDPFGAGVYSGNAGRWCMSYDTATGAFEELPFCPIGSDYDNWAVADGKLYVFHYPRYYLADDRNGLFVNVLEQVDGAWSWSTIYVSKSDIPRLYRVNQLSPDEVGPVLNAEQQNGQLVCDQVQGFQHGRKVYMPGFGWAFDLDTHAITACQDPGPQGDYFTAHGAAGWDNTMGLIPGTTRVVVFDGYYSANRPRIFDMADESWSAAPEDMVVPGSWFDGETAFLFDDDGYIVNLADAYYGSHGSAVAGQVGAKWAKPDGTIGVTPYPALPGLDAADPAVGIEINEAASVRVGDKAYLISGYVEDHLLAGPNPYDYASPYILPFDLATKTWGEPVLIPPPSWTADDSTGSVPTTTWSWVAYDAASDPTYGKGFLSVQTAVPVPAGTVLPPLPVVENWEFHYSVSSDWTPSAFMEHSKDALPVALSADRTAVEFLDPSSFAVLGQVPFGGAGMDFNELLTYFTRHDPMFAPYYFEGVVFKYLMNYAIAVTLGFDSSDPVDQNRIALSRALLVNNVSEYASSYAALNGMLYLGKDGVMGPWNHGSEVAQIIAKYGSQFTARGFHRMSLVADNDGVRMWAFVGEDGGDTTAMTLRLTPTERALGFGYWNQPAPQLVQKFAEPDRLYWRKRNGVEIDLTSPPTAVTPDRLLPWDVRNGDNNVYVDPVDGVYRLYAAHSMSLGAHRRDMGQPRQGTRQKFMVVKAYGYDGDVYVAQDAGDGGTEWMGPRHPIQASDPAGTAVFQEWEWVTIGSVHGGGWLVVNEVQIPNYPMSIWEVNPSHGAMPQGELVQTCGRLGDRRPVVVTPNHIGDGTKTLTVADGRLKVAREGFVAPTALVDAGFQDGELRIEFEPGYDPNNENCSHIFRASPDGSQFWAYSRGSLVLTDASGRHQLYALYTGYQAYTAPGKDTNHGVPFDSTAVTVKFRGDHIEVWVEGPSYTGFWVGSDQQGSLKTNTRHGFWVGPPNGAGFATTPVDTGIARVTYCSETVLYADSHA